MSINKQSRNADTRDLRKMDLETENVYLTTVVISRRADQIAEKQKEELRNRLEPFANDGDNLEEIQENREQIEISLMYERMPKPTLLATQEFIDNKTYWRVPSAPENVKA
jgi:hypothetical protein